MAGEGIEGEADQEAVLVVGGEEAEADKVAYGNGASEGASR